MKKIYFVTDPQGKTFSDIVAFDERVCIEKFVRSYLPIDVPISGHNCWSIFQGFVQAGYKMNWLEMPKRDSPSPSNPSLQ